MPSNCTKCSVSSSSLRTTCPACHATKRREELIVKDCSSSRVIPVPDRTTFRQVLDDFNRAVGGQYTNLYTESDREIALESTVITRKQTNQQALDHPSAQPNQHPQTLAYLHPFHLHHQLPKMPSPCFHCGNLSNWHRTTCPSPHCRLPKLPTTLLIHRSCDSTREEIPITHDGRFTFRTALSVFNRRRKTTYDKLYAIVDANTYRKIDLDAPVTRAWLRENPARTLYVDWSGKGEGEDEERAEQRRAWVVRREGVPREQGEGHAHAWQMRGIRGPEEEDEEAGWTQVAGKGRRKGGKGRRG
ncbi:hypothetical protein BJX64DRAFT_288646 [Aspergillus heterothallicus]